MFIYILYILHHKFKFRDYYQTQKKAEEKLDGVLFPCKVTAARRLTKLRWPPLLHLQKI